MPANVDGMVREGIAAYRAGRKDEARALLMRAVEIDEQNEQAWLWLSAVVDSVDEQKICLENVLAINPANERAKQGLSSLDQKSAPAPKAPPAQPDDVLAASSFTQPARGPVNNEDDELPSSIEWAPAPPTASSSASSNYRVDEPSSEDYDQWVSALNIGSAATSKPVLSTDIEEATRFISAPSFDDDDGDDLASLRLGMGSNDDLDEVDDLLNGPFSAPEAPPPPPTPASPPKRAIEPPRQSPVSPKADPLLESFTRDDDDVALIDDEEDEEEGDAFNEFDMGQLDASDFFQYIPKEITRTRLPGTNEHYPVMVILGLVLVILLNLGAAALLIMNLTS
jgi:tetratricopeptide (TPR) repeat protein